MRLQCSLVYWKPGIAQAKGAPKDAASNRLTAHPSAQAVHCPSAHGSRGTGAGGKLSGRPTRSLHLPCLAPWPFRACTTSAGCWHFFRSTGIPGRLCLRVSAVWQFNPAGQSGARRCARPHLHEARVPSQVPIAWVRNGWCGCSFAGSIYNAQYLRGLDLLPVWGDRICQERNQSSYFAYLAAQLPAMSQ